MFKISFNHQQRCKYEASQRDSFERERLMALNYLLGHICVFPISQSWAICVHVLAPLLAKHSLSTTPSPPAPSSGLPLSSNTSNNSSGPALHKAWTRLPVEPNLGTRVHFLFFFKQFLFACVSSLISERGREGERNTTVRDKHQWVASRMYPN